MIVDIGTGDGRAVLRRAAAVHDALVVGVDAAAAAMADASRRAARRGQHNAIFLAEGAERLATSPLAGAADLVTVVMPWGSLLSGVLGLDAATLAGITAVVAPAGRLEVLASVMPSDGVDGLDCLDASTEPSLRAAWRAAGLELVVMRPATVDDVAAFGSSWARRLGADRPVWRLVGRRSDASASIAR